jgi:hypothetical protein
MRVAYVSGHYKGDGSIKAIRENILIARAVAIELWRMGWAVICPHCNTAFFDGEYSDDPVKDRRAWLDGDIEMINRLEPGDAIVMLPRWETSQGAVEEKNAAVNNALWVFEWSVGEDRDRLKALAREPVAEWE